MKVGRSMFIAKTRLERRVACLTVIGMVAGLTRGAPALGADWPTYRCNIARTGVSADAIDPALAMHWTHVSTHAPKPAWPKPSEERHRMAFDGAYHVVCAGGLVYFGSSVDNRVTALDAATGGVRWTFCTDGPVRFAPTVRQDRVYVGSDDGYVYCLGAADGKLIWRYRPGPGDQKIIGNGRMISLWPIRTSVLVDDGVAYFGAGVFPYEGIYICALKADDGNVIWKNDVMGDRAHEITFGGVTPQGYLAASKDILYVPAGRAMPVAFRRRDGEYLFICSAGGKTGGSWTLVTPTDLIAGVDSSGTPAKILYDPQTGKRRGDAFAWFPGIDMVVAGDKSYTLTERGVVAIDRAKYAKVNAQAAAINKKTKSLVGLRKRLRKAKAAAKQAVRALIARETQALQKLEADTERASDSAYEWRYFGRGLCSLAMAGQVVFAGGQDEITALDAKTGKVLWNGEVDGNALGLAVADGRMFVSTDRGSIHCFSARSSAAGKVVKAALKSRPYPQDKLTPVYEDAAARILKETGVTKGYCLVTDCGTGRLACELAKRSRLNIVGLERDTKKVAAAREALAAAGLLGARVVVSTWKAEALPDYFANLVVSDAALTTGKVSFPPEQIARVLRPFGGVLYVGRPKGMPGPTTQAVSDGLVAHVKAAGLDRPTVSREGGVWVKGVRGKLAGAGSWTRLYGDTNNTACGDDQRVKAPFGVLWFGEPGPETMVERHARAASPVAANGRFYVQGEEVVTGVDAYNGTILWKRKIPGAVRVRVDVDDGNLSLDGNTLYVAAEDKCYRLDGETGKVVRVYEMPTSPDAGPRRWGYVAARNGTLFGSTAMPLKNDYASVWKALVENGAWRRLEDIPPRYASEFQRYKAKYPVPNALARADLQRSGALWRTVADFPVWGSQASPVAARTKQIMTSDSVFALNPETGRVKWVYRGRKIPQISVTISDGAMYLLDDVVTKEQTAAAIKEKRALVEKGVHETGDETKHGTRIADVRMVIALDAATGRKRWAKPLDLTGCGGDKMGVAYHDGLLLFFGHFSNHDVRTFGGNRLRWRRITAASAKTGEVVWSRPLNYLRRPVVVGDTIIIEPRACDVRTGQVKMRTHPITGEQVPWEFLRPGHSCSITSATPSCIFYRSYCGAIYDMIHDDGLVLFGGIRPGCWLNLIAANGLLTMPEASAGCTCSFPLRCTVTLKPRERRAPKPWSVFITHGAQTPVKRMGINFGAPGDRRDDAGRMWLCVPRPGNRRDATGGLRFRLSQPGIGYGIEFDVFGRILKGMGAFCEDYRDVSVDGTDQPWLFTSGYLGLIECEVPLIDDVWLEEPGRYTVRMGFAAPKGDAVGQRVFDVALQDKVVLKGFDIAKAAGGANTAVVKTFKGIDVTTDLKVTLVPKVDGPDRSQAPVVSFLEVVREDAPRIAAGARPVKRIDQAKADAMLAAARADLAANRRDEALTTYHAVLDASTSVAAHRAALAGMAAIGDAKSLGRIAPYCKTVSPILRGYKDVPDDLRVGSMDVYVAIADKWIGRDKAKAIRMLRHAMKSVPNMAVRDRVVVSLEKAGVRIDAEAARQGYVTRWQIVGPLESGKDHPADKVQVGEPAVDLKATYAGQSGKVAWQPFVSERARVDLAAVCGTQKAASAYAHARIVLDKDQDLLLKVGSDDGFKGWFNGQPVGRFDGARAWKADEDALKVRGKKGVNTVLLKVMNGRSDWLYSVRLTGPENERVTFRQP